eukprot:TRINITY_DN6299_c0_g1_i1.p1 TRINITY_DN6299_c0_g1~~TRINITY_DN6299_c0_g1_i1.p1  ORF type:complete len:191 (+),score=72.03 TRINITY_DN6299_c0_g1_i1:107-679(+)
MGGAVSREEIARAESARRGDEVEDEDDEVVNEPTTRPQQDPVIILEYGEKLQSVKRSIMASLRRRIEIEREEQARRGRTYEEEEDEEEEEETLRTEEAEDEEFRGELEAMKAQKQQQRVERETSAQAVSLASAAYDSLVEDWRKARTSVQVDAVYLRPIEEMFKVEDEKLAEVAKEINKLEDKFKYHFKF